MRRRRVAGRFYIFIAILLLAIFLVVRPHLNLGGGGEDVIFVWNSAFEQSMDCVFIRDERVEASEAVVRVEYLAKENTEVAQGDLIANLFTTGYSESLLKRLEEEGYLGGLPVGEDMLLWCATEKNTKAEMDRLAQLVKEVLA